MARVERYCYLRDEQLRALVTNERVLDALIYQLNVAGKSSTLKKLSNEEKLMAVVNEINHQIATPTSIWHKVPVHEVLAANVFEAEKLPTTLVANAFSSAKLEEDLLGPAIRWLKDQGYDDVYTEVPMGTKRADVVGYKKGRWFSSEVLVSVELKNEASQLKRALDQLVVFREYSHFVYLACTPFVAAEEVQRHANAKGVKHWDPYVFNSKLESTGFGLLLVEKEGTFEHVPPKVNAVPSKLGEAKEQMKFMPRL